MPEGWRAEEKAGYAAIVAFLAVVAVAVAFPGALTLRQAAALAIAAPASVMLGFYVIYSRVEDRAYKIGLTSLILVLALLLAGAPPRQVVVGYIALIAGLIVATQLLRGR